MLISRRYKFILLSNPKSGSTTLREVLALAADVAPETIYKDAEEEADVDFFKKSGLTFYPAYLFKKSIENIQDEESTLTWDDYYSFTTVRNPFVKMVSWYYALRPDKNFNTVLDLNSIDTDSVFHHHFNDFINHLATPEGERLKLPDYNYFCTDWDTGEDIVDDVFKLEEIDNSFQDKFKERIGLNVIKPLPKLNADFLPANKSDIDNYKGDPYDLYNENSKQLVSEWYAADIEKFNYEFGQ